MLKGKADMENANCCGPEPASPSTFGDVNEDIAGIAKALGHPVRVQIVRYLLEHGTCLCGDIADQIPLAQSTVSQHLKILKEAGIIYGEMEGTRVCYCVHKSRLDRFLSQLAEMLVSAAQPSESV